MAKVPTFMWMLLTAVRYLKLILVNLNNMNFAINFVNKLYKIAVCSSMSELTIYLL